MKLSPRVSHYCLALLAIPCLSSNLTASLIGDHRITEGMILKKKTISNYSIHHNSIQRLIYIMGTLDFGVVTKTKELLEKHPDSTGIVLESDGGNVYQARGLANIIMDQGLDTYSFSHCYSACTIAFIAGRKRHLGMQSELGFHCYSLESSAMKPLISIEHEQYKDLMFFENRIPDKEFVQKIFQNNSNELWIPKLNKLLESGVIHEILGD